jgi:hypothetical protein
VSDIQHRPNGPVFDDDFDKELIRMWKENAYSLPDNPSETMRQLKLSLKRFDRRILWRNVLEYGAAAVVFIRSCFEIASGERLLIVPLASIGVALFIVTYVWRKHRSSLPLDPTADANTYRIALLHRLDQQIQLARSVRYWYVLPAWAFFLTVLTSGILKGLSLIPLLVNFLLATALCIFVIWLNEKYGARKLETERRRIAAFNLEFQNQD